MVLLPPCARGADQALLLEVFINGYSTNLIGEFMKRGDDLLIKPEELKSLGLRVPDAVTGNAALVLSTLPGVTYTLDEQAQTLKIDAIPDSLIANALGNRATGPSDVPLAESGLGGVVNYDLLQSHIAGQDITSGLFDARVYRNAGVLSSSALGYYSAQRGYATRLDSTYTYSDAEALTQYRGGDFISGGLNWTRPVRMGGFQYETNFALRPDLVTFPIPNLRGNAVVPSTVDLFVNGIRQLSQPVPPGPFEINQPPIATGSGSVLLSVTDALGRQTLQNLSFYSSSRLLAAGLSSVSVEGGWLRNSYGIASNDYGRAAASATYRRGFTSALTGEAHGEAADSLAVLGAGVIYKVRDWGVVSTSFAGSAADGGGLLYSAGFERQTPHLSFSLYTQRTSPGYRDIGALDGGLLPRSMDSLGIGYYSDLLGAFNLTYNGTRVPRLQFNNLGVVEPGPTQVDEVKLLTATYSRSLFGLVYFYVTGFRDLHNHGSSGITLGLSIPLGRRDSLGGTANSSSGVRTFTVQTSRPTVSPGDLGWQLQDTQGDFIHRYAEVDYKSRWARSSLTFDDTNGQTSWRGGLTGSIIVADKSLFLANTINDSFAVVNTGGIPDVDVYADNHLVGKTNGAGRALATDLRAYDANQISIDPLSLPADAKVGETLQIVRPRDRSGTVVSFDVSRTVAAGMTLVTSQGKPLPLGSVVTVRGTDVHLPVGYEGRAYIEDIHPDATLDVELPDESRCTVTLNFKPVPGDISELHNVVCQP